MPSWRKPPNTAAGSRALPSIWPAARRSARRSTRISIRPKKSFGRVPARRTIFSPGAPSYLGPTLVISTVRKVKRSFVYDYRCIRTGRTIREVRNQVEQNGKKKIVPNAELQTVERRLRRRLPRTCRTLRRARPARGPIMPSWAVTRSATSLSSSSTPNPSPGRRTRGTSTARPGSIPRRARSSRSSGARVASVDSTSSRNEDSSSGARPFSSTCPSSAPGRTASVPDWLRFEEAYLNESGKTFIRSKTEAVYENFQFFKSNSKSAIKRRRRRGGRVRPPRNSRLRRRRTVGVRPEEANPWESDLFALSLSFLSPSSLWPPRRRPASPARPRPARSRRPLRPPCLRAR